MAKGISINIGLNTLDEDHYTGHYKPLYSCVRDAQNMADIADGFEIILLDEPGIATANYVKEKIRYASGKLTAGDILLVTFSGHGSQIPDLNANEDSSFDQTWCLYDRQIIDDELAQLWAEFKTGVRIFFLSDSCHSGSVIKTLSFPMYNFKDASDQNIDEINILEPIKFDEYNLGKSEVRVKKLEKNIRDAVLANHYADTYEPIIKGLKAELDAKGVNSFDQLITASLISISACEDDQEAKDGDDNGVFTAALKKVWNNGNFQGNYINFQEAIYDETKDTDNPKQNPRLMPINAEVFKQMRPFQI